MLSILCNQLIFPLLAPAFISSALIAAAVFATIIRP
jgi:hypothetical protein